MAGRQPLAEELRSKRMPSAKSARHPVTFYQKHAQKSLHDRIRCAYVSKPLHKFWRPVIVRHSSRKPRLNLKRRLRQKSGRIGMDERGGGLGNVAERFTRTAQNGDSDRETKRQKHLSTSRREGFFHHGVKGSVKGSM